jgi:hypothetical protein
MDGKLNQMTRVQQIEKVQRFQQDMGSTATAADKNFAGAHPALWGLLPERTDLLPAVPDCPEFQGCLKFRQSLNEQSPGRKRESEARGKILPAAPFQDFVAHYLQFFNRLERVQDQIELARAAGAGFEMFSHAHQHSVDWRAVEYPLRVLVQLIQTFRAGHFNFPRLLNLLEQPVNLLGG